LSDEPPGSAENGPPAAPAQPTVDIVFAGGIFGECLGESVKLFGDSLGVLSKAGYRISYAPVRGRAGSSINAEIIRAHVMKQGEAHSSLKTLLVSYSKGTSDALTALSDFPELAQHVAAVLSVAGVVNGSPLADDMAELYASTFAGLPYSACEVTDRQEVDSLTRKRRGQWLSHQSLPDNVLYFSIVGIPHPERVSRALYPFYRRLAYMDPLNDGQVVFYDAVIPESRLLAYVNADHWAIALPFEGSGLPLTTTFINQNHFPRAQMLMAAVREVEAGLSRQRKPQSSVAPTAVTSTATELN
jgi:hypothetical protein